MQTGLRYLLIALAAVFAIYGLVDAVRILRVRGWTEVDASIVSSTFKRVHVGMRRDRRTEIHYYLPDISYRYEVAGTSYTGTQVSALGDERTLAKAIVNSTQYNEVEDLVNRFPAGATTRARFDPVNPSRSYLDGAFPLRSLLGVLLTLGLAVGLALPRGREILLGALR